MTDDELIARWIEAHPWKSGKDEAILRESDLSIWAIVGDLSTNNGDIADTARGYGISIEAVQAALAYYRRHKCLIDSRLAANRA